jgi:peptidoglycan hydrolase-like protein with peptidoglycan-binding domain
VADPREGRSQRPDGASTHVNVCEHLEPVAELRRVYDAVSQQLGFRTLQQFSGKDVLQLEILLEALGYLASAGSGKEGEETAVFTPELAKAVDLFRKAEGLSTPESGSPSGLVDRDTVDRLWERLEASGKAVSVRERIRELTAVTR